MSTTRRDFVKAAAGAAVSIPYIWSSSPLRAREAGDRLRVAAIGVGGRGTAVGHQAGDRGDMAAVADVHRDHAERFAARYGDKCRVYQDYRELLERDDIDAITCGTPDHWHSKVVIDAMNAGKHVYCEKPLTLSVAEGKQICDTVRKTGKIFQVGTQQRSEFGRMFLKAVAIAQSGRLGERLHAVSSVGRALSGGPYPEGEPPRQLDWDMYCGQAPQVPFCGPRFGKTFRWWLEYSGGQVTDWGVHHTDIAIWALGGSETGVVEVEGKGDFPKQVWGDVSPIEFLAGKAKLPCAYNVTPSFDCRMKLPNGNTIQLISGPNELIIEGDRGKIRVNRGSLTGKPVDEINASEKDRQWLDERVTELYRSMPLRSHMDNFFYCIETGELPISDVFTHVHSVNACHFANIAMLLGRKITFDPEAYKFVGDEEAEALKSRPQREPYQIEV